MTPPTDFETSAERELFESLQRQLVEATEQKVRRLMRNLVRLHRQRAKLTTRDLARMAFEAGVRIEIEVAP